MAIVEQNVVTTTNSAISTERRGTPVRAIGFGGKIFDRIVWDEDSEVVYLCSQRCFDQLSAGDESIRPVGFPRADVQEIGSDRLCATAT